MIPPYLINRIANSETTGARLAKLFSNIAEGVEKLSLPMGAVTLDFVQEGDPIQPGDLIPQLHLTVIPAKDPNETTKQADPQAGEDPQTGHAEE
jgi:hypothetical protein